MGIYSRSGFQQAEIAGFFALRDGGHRDAWPGAADRVDRSKPPDDAGADRKIRAGLGEAETGAELEREVVGGRGVTAQDDLMFVGVAEVADGLKARRQGMGKGMTVAGGVSPGRFALLRPEGDQVDDEFVGGSEIGLDDEARKGVVFAMAVDAVV